MAFEIIMLMAAVAGECGSFQLIPCNLFFAFLFLPPLLLGLLLWKDSGLRGVSLGGGRRRLRRWSLGWTRFFGKCFVMTGSGLDSKAGLFATRTRTRARAPGTTLRDSGWSGAQAAEADHGLG